MSVLQPFEETNPEETTLRQGLRRVDAPAGFADRLMARAEAEAPKRAKVLMFQSPVVRAWVGGAIAALLMLGVFAGQQQYERQQLRRQAQVEQQFDTAMRVTDHALDQTRTRLERAGISLGN